MSNRVQCVFYPTSGKWGRWLRRYSGAISGTRCPNYPGEYSYHNALSLVDYFVPTFNADGLLVESIDSVLPPKDDPRWPAACSCGYTFLDADEWQVFFQEVWLGPDGNLWQEENIPDGGMFFKDYSGYMPNFGSKHWKERGRGPHLHVRCPRGGVWDIDQGSSNGDGWTREGIPPLVTARPSILFHGRDGEPAPYHGFLTAGFLEEC